MRNLLIVLLLFASVANGQMIKIWDNASKRVELKNDKFYFTWQNLDYFYISDRHTTIITDLDEWVNELDSLLSLPPTHNRTTIKFKSISGNCYLTNGRITIRSGKAFTILTQKDLRQFRKTQKKVTKL